MLRAWRGRLGKFREFSFAERMLLSRSVLDIVKIHVSLRRRGYAATLESTARMHPAARHAADLSPERVVRIVNIAARWTIGVKTSCLRRAILSQWLLRSANIPCTIASGMRLVDGSWQGHAWVETGGVPIAEPAMHTSQYSVFREEMTKRYAGIPNANSAIEPSSK